MKKTPFLIASLGMSSLLALHAVPRPGGPGEPEIIPLELAEDKNAQPKEEQAFLGVSGTPLSQLLAEHLKLSGGLVIGLVADDSPAQKAGLTENDIILKVGNKAVASQDQLSDVMRTLVPGDSQVLTVVRRGETITLDVIMGIRPVALAQGPRAGAHNVDDLFRQALGHLPQGGGGGNAADIMQQLQERMGQMGHGMHDLDQLFNLGNGAGAHGLGNHFDRMRQMMGQLDGQFDIQGQSSSTFTIGDEQGKITIKETEAGKEIVVRDPKGNVIFEGPFSTEIDKAAVPEDIINRLKGVQLQGMDLGLPDGQ